MSPDDEEAAAMIKGVEQAKLGYRGAPPRRPPIAQARAPAASL